MLLDFWELLSIYQKCYTWCKDQKLILLISKKKLS